MRPAAFMKETTVRREEQLSDHAYYYNSQEKKVEMAIKPEQEKSEFQEQNNERNR